MIHAIDLSKQFGEFWAVDGLSLEVHAGQVLVLLGQNGAGKTTTVRMLTSVLRPTRGSARVAGYDVVKQASHVRMCVGVLTEQHGLYLRMTGEEYLDFYGQVYGLASQARNQRSHYLFEYFGLTQVAHQSIGQYSKGMRQKLALARTLIHEPPVLLLDEPTSAMDPESARLVRDHIASLRSKNRAIIICTHNLAEAEALADQIAIIYKGRLLIKGTLQDLRKKILGPPEYEVKFQGEWPEITLRLPEGVRMVRRRKSSLLFRVDQPKTSNPVLLLELVRNQLPIVSFQEVPYSLEQIYLRAMEHTQRGGDAY